MRNILIFFCAITLVACGHRPQQRLRVDQSSPLFKGESLWRISGQAKTDNQWLMQCYQGDVATFTQKAREAYAQGAKSARYWSWLGNCLAWHNELREAHFFFGLALGVVQGKEEEAMVKNNLAVVYLKLGRVVRAFDLLVEAGKLAPQFVTPAFNIIQIYVAQNMNREALQLLSRAPFETSADPEVLHLKGLAHLQNGDAAAAGIFLQQIPEIFHTREDFALTLAHWHLELGRPARAQELLSNYESTGLSSTAQISERLKRTASQQLALQEARHP